MTETDMRVVQRLMQSLNLDALGAMATRAPDALMTAFRAVVLDSTAPSAPTLAALPAEMRNWSSWTTRSSETQEGGSIAAAALARCGPGSAAC